MVVLSIATYMYVGIFVHCNEYWQEYIIMNSWYWCQSRNFHRYVAIYFIQLAKPTRGNTQNNRNCVISCNVIKRIKADHISRMVIIKLFHLMTTVQFFLGLAVYVCFVAV